MIAKNLEINGKTTYIRDLDDFLRELFIQKTIDLYTLDVIKEEIALISKPDPNEIINELKEDVDDLRWKVDSLEDQLSETEDVISKITNILDEYNSPF